MKMTDVTGGNYLEVLVNRTLRHKGHNNLKRVNDVALILLEKSVQFDDYLRPACLYPKSDDPEDVIATGWGATKFGVIVKRF